jgi:monoamine oxidase
LPVELSTPVSEIAVRGREDVEITLPQGSVAARAAIVTVSTNVLAGGAIAFKPELPKRQRDACAKLSLGSYERIILEMPDNPLGLQRNDLVFEKAASNRTAALLANVNGTTLAFVDIGGSFGREVAARGRRAMVEFATGWLADLYGAEIRKAVQRTHATQWSANPLIQGAFSAASVGGQPSRKILMEPLRERIFFAGEAVHETLWGTVAGAWESGERAADAALKYLAAPPPRPQRERRRRRR